MKFSSALSLAAAPLAVAKAVHNVYPVRRDVQKRDGHSSSSSSEVSPDSVQGVPAALASMGMSGAGITNQRLNGAQVVIIWLNGGGGAATTQINPQQTITVTQTVVGGAPTAPTGAPPPANGGAAPPPSGTQPQQQTHTVTVGGPKGLIFQPQETKAAVGDMVVFTFLSNNHTVSQSAFETPCDPLSGGMDSGFQPNANNSVNPPPQVAMQVMVDTPLWFYCRQQGHCGKGMVFSINPTAAKTHAMFQGMAIAQKGTGSGSAITGNPPAGGAPAPAPPAAAPPAAAPAAGTPGTPVPVAGTGTLNPDGSCACAVMCGAGTFPAVQAQGLGAFGGMAAGLPATMLAA